MTIELVKPARPRCQDKRVNADDLVVKDLPPIRWIAENLLPEGLCVFAGRPKVGKSWLMLNLCEAVANGSLFLGKTTVKQGRALYLALEDSERRLKKRLTRLGGSFSNNLDIVTIGKFSRIGQGGMNELEDYLSDGNYRFVAIDTLTRIKPIKRRNPGDYDEESAIAERLQKLSMEFRNAMVLTHHSPKVPSDDYVNDVIGSTGTAGVADMVMVLRRERGQNTAVLLGTSRDMEDDVSLGLRFRRGDYVWELVGDARDVMRSPERQAIVDLLRREDRMLSPTEIAKFTGQKVNNIQRLLSKMVEDDDLINDHGKYTPR